MSELAAALHQVASELDEAEIPYMVIGGLANLVWGDPRTTRDVDVTADISQVGTEGILEVAGRLGRPLADDPRDIAERGRLVPLRTDSGVRVDLVLAALPFEMEAIRRAREIEVEGVPVRVCTPEDLIVMKSVSRRPRDHEDVIGVLRRQRDSLDLDALESTITGLAEDLADPEIASRWKAARRIADLRHN